MYFSICIAVLLVACYGMELPADSVDIKPDAICKRRNQYIDINGNCDSYIECRDYQAISRDCPDGLHYNDQAKWPEYPCGYPSDVPCKERSIMRSPQPTADCPRQFGFFSSPLAVPEDCGHYRMCVSGRGIEMFCPTGLAFSPESGRCDWPENVPSCKSPLFNYPCPPASYDEDGYPIITNHKYEDNCFGFYMCNAGKSRLLSCDPGFAFDSVSGRCIDEDLVTCTNEMVPQNE